MLTQFNVSLWGDEGFSAILSMKSVPEIISIITRDTSPPLYNLTEHYAFQFFGTSEIVIRGLSFFYYLIAVFFVFLIAKHFSNIKAAVLAALLTFFNPFFFIYAFEGRMYAILAATVVASMYFFIKKNWIGYVIATALALYSHHFEIFALFVQGIVFLAYLLRPKTRKTALKIFISFIAIGILYLPWVLPLYNQTKMVGGGFWLGTPTLVDLRKLIYKFLSRGTPNLPQSAAMMSHYSLYVVFAILALRKWHKKVWQSSFLLLWFLGPILATWAISQRFTSVFYDRYLLYTIPAGMIILATKTRKISFLIAVGILLPLFAFFDLHYFTHPTKKPFRELAAYVQEFKKGDDYLINWNGASHHLWETKYYGIPAPIYIPGKESPSDLPFFVGTALMTDEDIVGEIPKKIDEYPLQRVIAVTSDPAENVVIEGFAQQEVKEFDGLRVVWLEKR